MLRVGGTSVAAFGGRNPLKWWVHRVANGAFSTLHKSDGHFEPTQPDSVSDQSEPTSRRKARSSRQALQTRWNNCVLPALETFRALHGHCNVPQKFKVPNGDASWPPDTWQLNLGLICDHIRRKRKQYMAHIEADRARWDRLEFVWDAHDYRWQCVILPALETFETVFGHVVVPYTFVVPHESPWPTAAWGERLGVVVRCICNYGYYRRYVERDQERWRALGFEAVQIDKISS